MKISNAITIIALGLQGFLLHTDAASNSPFGLRGGGDSVPDSGTADFDNINDPDLLRRLGAANDYPDDSEFAVNFDEDEEATDFVLDSSVTDGTGTGVYLQVHGATRHGTRCRSPFPACGRNSRCMLRRGHNPICVDDDKCIPSRVITTKEYRSECCNGYHRERYNAITGYTFFECR
jgi:hypothetical protein